MISNFLKQNIKQYLTLTLWFIVHQDDKDISTNQFEVVLQEISRVEEALRNNGVSETAIQKLNDFSKKLHQTPIDQLTPNAQLRICKIIFGEGTEWAK